MRVSVVICTWNRSELLRDTLESVRSLVVPPGQEWELLVVNNNSTDATDQVLASFESLLPLRRLFEREIGLSRARNAAGRAANGDLILFTDDDVHVHPNWMTAYLEAARNWPDAQYFGGEIRPWFAEKVPGWVKRSQTTLDGMLCLRDAGPISRPLGPGEFPFGPNMAIRREALALASFDERVGRKGDEQVRGSERSLFLALQRQGSRGVWVPAAKVEHYIPRCRANVKYLVTYYHGMGRAEARLLGCGPHFRRELFVEAVRVLMGLGRRPWTWRRHLASMARITGQLRESRQPAVRHETLPRERADARPRGYR